MLIRPLINTIAKRLQFLEDLFNQETITFSYDNLENNSKVQYEVLYTTDSQGEEQPAPRVDIENNRGEVAPATGEPADIDGGRSGL